jgi:hypothetical protein
MKHPSNLAEAWWAFSMDVLHPEAPAIQVSEMRRAFYAGAASLLGLRRRGVAMEDLRAELEDFAGAVLDHEGPPPPRRGNPDESSR